MQNILKQRAWTDTELIAAGFHYYERKKQLVMAARLPGDLAPLEIHYPLETVIANEGDVICFDPGDHYRPALVEYDHWSVKYSIFIETYRNWDQSTWTPSPQVRFLMERGCKPYYKAQGAWSKQVNEPVWIQSLESPDPLEVPSGMWLMIGTKGEPWHVEDDKFRERYIIEGA